MPFPTYICIISHVFLCDIVRVRVRVCVCCVCCVLQVKSISQRPYAIYPCHSAMLYALYLCFLFLFLFAYLAK